MISGTFLAIFLVPVFFVVVRGVFKMRATQRHPALEARGMDEDEAPHATVGRR